MPSHTGSPSQYSKDQLKNLLISHNVPVPQGEQRKAVYLQLYFKHILPKDKEAADFSSDEDVLADNDPIEDHEEQRSDQMELKSLSDSELKEQLKKHGVNPGPILPTTRTLYEKKLRQLLEEKQLKENGGGQEDQYSDSEDEGVQVKNMVDTGYELNGDRVDRTHSFDSYSHKNVPACIAAEFNQTVATLVDGFSVSKVLKKMERRSYVDQVAGYGNEQESKNLIYNSQEDDASADYSDLLPQSSLVMSATRRKPIKGAAGRPVQFRYDDIATRARMQEQTKETSTEGKPQRLVSVRLQIVIFIIVAFIALVYITMESSPENPFTPVPEEGQQP